MTASAEEELPAWSVHREEMLEAPLASQWPLGDARSWAWGGASGAGVRVCIVDSGIDAGHPMVGSVHGAMAVVAGEAGSLTVAADHEGDAYGHGTACAGIVRKLAPDCELHSIRVLGGELTGTGPILLHGLRWAIDQGFEVINLSLSTTKSKFAPELRELADRAYFQGSLLVASAHNMPVESFPWRFSAVLSVGSHAGADPLEYYSNPAPPVEFAAPGVDLELAWLDGETIRATGNSFATPHMAGIAALILSKHPGLTPFELKTALRAASSNVRGAG
ncbi:MAG: S8 family serine peptidase [Solirubrobacteraceae bacterium]